MTLVGLGTLLLLGGGFSCSPADDVPPDPGEEVLVDWRIDYRFQGKDLERMELFAVLPRSIPGRQELVWRELSLRPTSVELYRGESIGVFQFIQPGDTFRFTISGRARIFPWSEGGRARLPAPDIKGMAGVRDSAVPASALGPMARQSPSPVARLLDSLAQFLGPPRVGTDMMQAALALQGMATWQEQRRDLSLEEFVAGGRGDCTEFAALGEAYCRRQGLEARRIGGLQWRDAANPFHSWSECRLPDGGWAHLDPTWAGELARLDTVARPSWYFEVSQIDSLYGPWRWVAWRYAGKRPVMTATAVIVPVHHPGLWEQVRALLPE